MPNNAVRAAAEGLPKITRRKALALTGALATTAAAATVASSVSAPAAGAGRLMDLIEAHKAAHLAFLVAIDHEQAMEQAYFETHPKEILVPLAIGGAQTLHVQFDLDEYADSCRKEIVARYDQERKRLSSLRHLAPEVAVQAEERLTAGLEADLKTLSRIVRAERKQRKAFGYEQACQKRDDASNAEMDAAEALLAYPCRSAAEGKTRLDYIMAEGKGQLGRIVYDMLAGGDDRLVHALLFSTAAEA